MIGVIENIQYLLEENGEWNIDVLPLGHPTYGYRLILSRDGQPQAFIDGMMSWSSIVVFAQAPNGKGVARKKFRVLDEYAENVGRRSERIDYDRLYADVIGFIDGITTQGKRSKMTSIVSD